MPRHSEPEPVKLPRFDRSLKGVDEETRKLVSFYDEHGYVVIDPEIPDEVIEAVNAAVRDRFVVTRDPYYADEMRIQDFWNFNEDCRAIATAPRVMDLLRILYGREPIPFQTLNFRVGSQQRTHSDIIHFDSLPYGYMCGVWLAMEDVDTRNGPLHYFPVSHTLPRYDMRDVKAPEQAPQGIERYPFYEDFVEKMLKGEDFDRVEVKMKRGQALIWSANLYHGGSPIIDSMRTRLTQVTHYYFEGCLFYTPLFSDLATGRLAVREVLDVRTGRLAPQYYKGRRVRNPGQWPPDTSSPTITERLKWWWRT